MAKSNSFRKREIEKNKAQKRREKQKRREERKKNAPDSFEDMIAYVDEFGVITDTPPDPTEVEEIKAEDIEVSIPKDEPIDEDQELSGRVEFFNDDKGFGFIKDKGSVEKYFFHISNAPDMIRENDNVTFRLEKGPKGMNAVEVKIVE
ncbi:MAG: cold-shock protein [Bacteroides sp.]